MRNDWFTPKIRHGILTYLCGTIFDLRFSIFDFRFWFSIFDFRFSILIFDFYFIFDFRFSIFDFRFCVALRCFALLCFASLPFALLRVALRCLLCVALLCFALLCFALRPFKECPNLFSRRVAPRSAPAVERGQLALRTCARWHVQWLFKGLSRRVAPKRCCRAGWHPGAQQQ